MGSLLFSTDYFFIPMEIQLIQANTAIQPKVSGYPSEDFQDSLFLSVELPLLRYCTLKKSVLTLKSSMFCTVSSIHKDTRALFGFSILHFNLDITSWKLPGKIIMFQSFVSLFLAVTIYDFCSQMS